MAGDANGEEHPRLIVIRDTVKTKNILKTMAQNIELEVGTRRNVRVCTF
jgi:hypothetical protein